MTQSSSGARREYPAMSLLSALVALRRVGVESAHRLEGVTEAELLSGARVLVPWASAARYYDAVVELTSDQQRVAMVREFVLFNPVIRTLGLFSSTLNEWLRLFWRVSQGYSFPFELRYEAQADRHTLSCRVPPEEPPASGFLLLTHLSATQVPLVVNAPALRTVELECSERVLTAVYEVPVLELGSPERIAAASCLSLGSVFQSLELLGLGVAEARQQGLTFPPHLAQQIDEASLLAVTWHLTPTEARVALALGDGQTPAQIALDLSVAVATVRVHLKHVYAKTETANQRELVERVRAWRGR